MARVRNENLKDLILQKTMEMLKTRTFHEISLASIAKEANISKGTLYYYYRSKEEIIYDITDISLERLSNDLICWLENKEKDTSVKRLVNYTFLRGSFDPSANLRLFLYTYAISGNEGIRRNLLNRYNYFKSVLTSAIEKKNPDLDREYIVSLILLMMDGIIIQSSLKNEMDFEGIIQKTISLLGL